MVLTTLKFSEEELNKIGKIARERKFKVSDDKFIYPEKTIDEIKLFCKSYRFLTILSNSIEEENLRNRIKEYLAEYQLLYKRLLKTESKLNGDISFGDSAIIRRANNIIVKNRIKILLFFDSVFPIGRHLKLYNPDDSVGVY